jgi:hypothetical protein
MVRSARYEVASVRVHLRCAVDAVDRPPVEVHLDLELSSEKLMAFSSLGRTHAGDRKIQRRQMTEPLRDRQPQHPDVHHRHAGDEPDDEDEAKDDAHPPMKVDEECFPVQ